MTPRPRSRGLHSDHIRFPRAGTAIHLRDPIPIANKPHAAHIRAGAHALAGVHRAAVLRGPCRAALAVGPVRDDEERRAVVGALGQRVDRDGRDARQRHVEAIARQQRGGIVGQWRAAGCVLIEVDRALRWRGGLVRGPAEQRCRGRSVGNWGSRMNWHGDCFDLRSVLELSIR